MEEISLETEPIDENKKKFYETQVSMNFSIIIILIFPHKILKNKRKI